MDDIPMDLDLVYIAKYKPKAGIKVKSLREWYLNFCSSVNLGTYMRLHLMQVAVDTAVNLPWSGFTLGIFSLNPPAAFYQVYIL